MIDAATGIITFQDAVLGPWLSLSAFFRSDLSKRAGNVIDNPPYYTCDIRTCRSVLDFIVGLSFHRRGLVTVMLCHASDEYGTSFADYTPDRIALHKQRHDAWLADVCRVTPGRFPWGKVDSYHTDRDLRTAIDVTYYFPVEG